VRVATWALVLTTVGLLGSCSSPVPGIPTADDKATTEQMFDLARTSIAAASDNPSGRHTAYLYIQFGKTQKGTESYVSILGGRDASFVEARQSKLDPELKITQFHQAGSTNDMLRLEGKFTALEPTPWVSYPTAYPAGANPTCGYPSMDILCPMDKARVSTEASRQPGLPHSSTVLQDGAIQLNSGTTLSAMIDQQVILFTDDVSRQITPDMSRAIIPVRIVLDPNHEFRSMEIQGEVPGTPNPLKIQMGFEQRGAADTRDFPTPPNPNEVTSLPDKQARDALWAKILAPRQN
jgi:hypothetical protein